MTRARALAPEAHSELGARLRGARHAAGLTGAEVGAELGVAGGYVFSMESARSTPSLGMLVALGDVLGVDPGSFITGLHLLGDD